ncbi:clumping factor A-like [Eriocheir sinensis]|uniref:clumping factor A-like n=1 Tax=Eriocheir sinensis TaxID=95602 RepID=UPI0021C6AE46|nr:clumping factor A-like [Eriocheir sinensis]
MEDPIEFVKVEVKEEPMDHQGSSSHFPSSSGVDGVRSRSGDVKEEEVWIKDEPFEEVDPNAVNTTTFTPKPESTGAKDSAQHKSKPHTAEGSTAPLHVTTAALPQETATDQDDSGSDSDEAAELEGESSVGGCTMESGRTSQSVSTKPTSSGVTSTKKRGMKRDRNGTAAASNDAPGPSGYRPAPRQRPLNLDKYLNLLFPTDDNDNDVYDSVFDLDSDSDTDSESDSDSNSELSEGEDDHLNREVPLLETPDFSFAWSEGSDFVPDLHEFCSDRSGLTKDWPCNDQANESDFPRLLG